MKTGQTSAASDAELVQLALADRGRPTGGRAASLLLERYQEHVYLWCLRFVRDHEQALDLAQEVLLTAYRRLETFEGRSGFASWIFAIARNRCLYSLRRKPLLLDVEDAAADVTDPAPGPDELLETKLEEEEALDLVLRHLDPLEQTALWLRCYEGLSIEEITRLLEIDTATGARGILQRARRKLRAALDATSRR